MKVKLIKVATHSETVSWNYGDDYSDVTRHIVSETTPWTEVDANRLYNLQQFISDANAKKGKSYYILVQETQPYTVELALEDMLAAHKKAEAKRKQEEKKIEEDRKAKVVANAAKKKARLEKQLAKLQEELGK